MFCRSGKTARLTGPLDWLLMGLASHPVVTPETQKTS